MNPTDKQIDELREFVNVGVGRAASVLNTMLKSHIVLKVPLIKVLSPEELREEIEALGENRLSAVYLGFKGGLSGGAMLVFPEKSAQDLVTVSTGEETTDSELDSIRAGTLSELGNVVLNGVMGSIANKLKLRLLYSVPRYAKESVEDILTDNRIVSGPLVLFVRVQFQIENLHVVGDIILFFKMGTFDTLLAALDHFPENLNAATRSN